MSYLGKNILITGGLGFIGSSLAIPLVKSGAKVTLVDSLIPDYGGNLANVADIRDNVAVNIADVRDVPTMRALVKDRDIIFNLAGTLSHSDSMSDPHTDLEINCKAQLTLLEACRAFNPTAKIIFAGTRGQYGKSLHLPVTEDHPQIPADVNGINKIAGEHYHMLYHRVYGLRTTSLRLTNTYGPRHQMRHHKQGIINWFIRLAMEGKNITLFGDGTQIRDINYVDDVVEAFLLAGASEKSDGEAYNLGGEPLSLLDVINYLQTHFSSLKYAIAPFPESSLKIEIGDYVADYNKIKRALGWQPKVRFAEGLEKTIAYYQDRQNAYF